jgi:hypothetical protein
MVCLYVASLVFAAATFAAGHGIAAAPPCEQVVGVDVTSPHHYSETNASDASGCCASCGADLPRCRYWSFKPSDVPKGIACRRFGSPPTHNRSASPGSWVAGMPPPARPPPPPQPSPVRLKVDRGQLKDARTGVAVRLVGFNWNIGGHMARSDDGVLMKSVLPATNLARIVGLLWDNSNGASDCMTAAGPPYFKETCFARLDKAVKAATDAGIWVVLTARCKYAAGQNYATDPSSDVFHNSTLRGMLFSAWKEVAAHYASWPYIAAFEVMSEPRDKAAAPTVIQKFYAEGCAAIASADGSNTPCMVGPGPYYKLWRLDDAVHINSSNIIYTFDYFVPAAFTFGTAAMPVYPGVYACGDLYEQQWASTCCAVGGPNASTSLNASWHSHNFARWAVAFRHKFQAPVIVNQWSAVHGVSAAAGRFRYMADVARALQAADIGWAWWVWRGGGSGTWSHGSSEFLLEHSDGTHEFDTAAIAAVKPFM